jgi:hypothetical protein
MKKILLLSAVGISLALGSATLISGTTQSVSFNSEPEGATVLIDGVKKCQTPCTLSLKRGSSESVTFKKDGYKTQILPLESSYNGVALLSVFWDFSTTDVISGAASEYSPNQYFVELKEEKSEK